MVATERNISLLFPGSSSLMPYCFSINTINSSASIESRPRPSTKRGALVSMSSGVMSSRFKASIICFFRSKINVSILGSVNIINVLFVKIHSLIAFFFHHHYQHVAMPVQVFGPAAQNTADTGRRKAQSVNMIIFSASNDSSMKKMFRP